jgi:hypothetical protein
VYLLAESVAPEKHRNVKLFRRHVALVDVDEGSAALGTPAKDDTSVITPSSYVFDVFRVSGGRKHTYCYHGCVDDDFDINVTGKTVLQETGDSEEERYMRNFRYARYYEEEIKGKAEGLQKFIPQRDSQWAADVDGDVLQATWRLERQVEERMHTDSGTRPTDPRKYTRLHLFDQAGSRALHGIAVDKRDAARSSLTRPHTSGRCIFLQKKFDKESDSVFVALHEPYAGQPFITERTLLDIPGNETDALRAAAVAVKTTSGRSDLCFADGRPEETRTLPGGIRVAGEFAYVSRDGGGLRQVSLTGGMLLETPDMTIRLEKGEYRGVVKSVKLIEGVFDVEGIPAIEELAGQSFEIGNNLHRTSFQISHIDAGSDGLTKMQCRKNGLEIMRATIIDADHKAGRLTTNIAMQRYRGRDAGLCATSDDLSKRWKVRYEGGNRHEGHRFLLTGKPITQEDFPIGGCLSVWEFDAGDEISLKTGVSITRGKTPGTWDVYANAPFTLSIKGAKLRWSADGTTWIAVKENAPLGPGVGMPGRFTIMAEGMRRGTADF